MKTIFQNREFNVKHQECFVLMPFTKKWSDRIWNNHLKEIITKCGMQCLRADELYGRHIIQDIWDKINESRIIIADITGRNPNVCYELGLAHALEKDVIIISQNVKDIPFDLSNYRTIIYQDNSDGYEKLEKELPKNIENCLFSDLVDNFGNRIENNDFLLLYLSTGGTCRCVISNVITRQLLKNVINTNFIRPMSAGLAERTHNYLSKGASNILLKKFPDFDVLKHRTVKADFELLKRADLILTMDLKLLRSIPKEFTLKSKLVSMFFGERGIVIDPYGTEDENYEYEKCFNKLYNLISNNLTVLTDYHVATLHNRVPHQQVLTGKVY